MAHIDSIISLPLLWLLVGTGCASESGTSLDMDDDDGFDTGADAQEDDEVGDDGDTTTSVHFALSGTLVWADGAPDPLLSTLVVTFLESDDVRPNLSPVERCSITPTLTTLEETTVDDTSAWLTGWDITWEEASPPEVDTDDSCAWAVPTPLWLGFGPNDPFLLGPALEHESLSDVADALLGLYVQYGTPSSPLFLFGVTGTDEQLEGLDDTFPTEAPTEGGYHLTTLYLLPLNP